MRHPINRPFRAALQELPEYRQFVGVRGINTIAHVVNMPRNAAEYSLGDQSDIFFSQGSDDRLPYGVVEQGHIVFLKVANGPVIGVVQIAYAESLQVPGFEKLRGVYGDRVDETDPAWQALAAAPYATLMRIAHPARLVRSIPFSTVTQKWVTLHE